jgi:hypothetical protein
MTQTKETPGIKIAALYGIDIVIDNRIRYGALLPYKKRTSAMRCSKETLSAIKHSRSMVEHNKKILTLGKIKQRGVQGFDDGFLIVS